MTTIRIAKDILEKKVSVTYPDGKNSHELTVFEVIERFKSEDSNWLDVFINKLINTGTSFTNFGGEYKLIK